MKKAFTLIELLVVIAIIAILAAILFPVFAQAKAAAKKSADLSNIKQLGTALIMYSSDYDDFYPRGFYPDPNYGDNGVTWRETTQPYVKSGGRSDGTYSNNQKLAVGDLWRSPTEPSNSKYGYAGPVSLLPWHNANPASLEPSRSQTSLEKPAGTMIITTVGVNPDWSNSSSGFIEYHWWWHGGAQYPPAWTGPTSGAQWDNDLAGCNWTPTGPGPSCAMPRYRYTESANIAWADGHAKTMKKGALNWCRDIYTGFSINGEDWSWMFTPGGICAAYVN
ncbi:MAG: prepilin-type N-terminal cleavage/methylation domain-containing protein [Armatimonadetes bacterium]|nr:prepilin-type N-terminal cleavage/methylation domain-containing protein [Armatimonadota bacterium]